MTAIHVRDPVDGGSVSFLDEDAEEVAGLFLELGDRHWPTIKEVFTMAMVVLFGTAAFDPDRPPSKVLERDAEQLAKWNSTYFSYKELFDILDRADTAIEAALRRETDPVKRARLRAVLAKSDENMKRLAARCLEIEAERKQRARA
jgi:hypothetical protein